MTATAWVFHGTPIVKPVPVIFGGLQCDAIEIMAGAAAGVYVRVPGGYMDWCEEDEDTRFSVSARGWLKCDGCHRFYEFMADGRILSFPFSPLPGWMVWNPSPLAAPDADPQVLTVRVRCQPCAKQRDGFVADLFRKGHP
jgi:hypothetical protein